MLVEIALSMLARSQSANTRGDLQASDHLWRRVRLLYQARMLDPFQPGGGRNKSFRLLVRYLSFFFCLPYFMMETYSRLVHAKSASFMSL